MYLSSADWMPRNLDRRVELMFPVRAAQCRRKVLDALDALFRDNVKGRRLAAERRVEGAAAPARHRAVRRAGCSFCEQAARAAATEPRPTFEPRGAPEE